MAAAATDKFRKVARRWVGQIGAAGVTDAVVTTIPLSSTTNLPTDTGVSVVIDRVDANGTATSTLEESITGVVSGNNLVSCVRGVEGTAQAHTAGAVVEVLITADNWNDFVDGFVVEHGQDGTHATTIVKTTSTQTLTNKRVTPRVVTATDDATAVIDCDVTDQYQLTAVANATVFTVTGTPTNGQKLLIRLKDAGAGKALTWTGFTAIGVTLPTTTVASKTHYIGCIYNSAASTWDAIAVGAEA